MVVSGFGKMIGLESGVMTGTQKLGRSLALPPAMFESVFWLVEAFSFPAPVPFSVAAKPNVVKNIIINCSCKGLHLTNEFFHLSSVSSSL